MGPLHNTVCYGRWGDVASLLKAVECHSKTLRSLDYRPAIICRLAKVFSEVGKGGPRVETHQRGPRIRVIAVGELLLDQFVGLVGHGSSSSQPTPGDPRNIYVVGLGIEQVENPLFVRLMPTIPATGRDQFIGEESADHDEAIICSVIRGYRPDHQRAHHRIAFNILICKASRIDDIEVASSQSKQGKDKDEG